MATIVLMAAAILATPLIGTARALATDKPDYNSTILADASLGSNENGTFQINFGAGISYKNNGYVNESAQWDFDDLRFTEDDGDMLLDHNLTAINDYSTLYSSGTSQPFTSLVYPEAITDGNYTYVVFNGDGPNPIDKYINVCNHTSGTWSGASKIAEGILSSDDHGAPSICMDSSGYLHVFYGAHHTTVYHIKTDNPAPHVSSWSSATAPTSDGSYPQSWVDSSGTMHLLYRNGIASSGQWCYRNSTNSGTSWSSEQVILDALEGVYEGEPAYTDAGVYMAWTYYNYSGLGLNEDMFGGFFSFNDWEVYSMDGDNLGVTVSYAEANTYCLIEDTNDQRVSAPHTRIDNDGNVYVQYNAQNASGYWARLAKWDVNSWTVTPFGSELGNYFNNGDLVVYSEDYLAFYYVTAGAAGEGGDLELWEYDTGVWTDKGTILTEAAAGNALCNVHVVWSVDGEVDSLVEAVFCEIDIGDYSNSDLGVYAAYHGAREQVQKIITIIEDPTQIPIEDFDGANEKVQNKRKNTMLNRLDDVLMNIEIAETSADPEITNDTYQTAIDQLNSILDKTDGCSERGTPDTNGSKYTPDWIVNCESQAKIDPLLRNLIATIEAQIMSQTQMVS